MTIEFIISAFILGVVVAIPPGSVTVIACQRAIQYGFRNSMIFTLGSSVSDALYLSLVYFGLAGFISNSGMKLTLWTACGLLLIVIGVLTLASAGGNSTEEANGAVGLQSRPWVTFVSGIVVTLTNPMTIIGWIAVAGNYFMLWNERLPATGWHAPVTITIIMLGVLAWFVPLVYAAGRLGRIISQSFQKKITIIAGACLVAFGLVSLWAAFAMR
jgi:threonine/homoserine/homoserine lactone efflux protein